MHRRHARTRGRYPRAPSAGCRPRKARRAFPLPAGPLPLRRPSVRRVLCKLSTHAILRLRVQGRANPDSDRRRHPYAPCRNLHVHPFLPDVRKFCTRGLHHTTVSRVMIGLPRTVRRWPRNFNHRRRFCYAGCDTPTRAPSMTDSVKSHYGGGTEALASRIRDSLLAAGKDPANLTAADLASIDEFHIRGRKGTLELGERMELRDDAHVLDIGSG